MIPANDIPNTVSDTEIDNWTRMLKVLRFLRSKDGCPWDQEQTVQSLRANLIEESSELLDAINRFTLNTNEHTHTHLTEEFGDVLLVTTMMMIIYEEEAPHAISHVYRELAQKIIRRHPHVFSKNTIESPAALGKQWDTIKTEQEGKKDEPLNTHKSYMHVLERAREVQKKVEKNALVQKISFQEKRTALIHLLEQAHDLETQLPHNAYQSPAEHIESVIGQALFMLVDLARSLKVHPTAALSYYTEKFITQHTHTNDEVFEIPEGTKAIIFDMDGTLIHSEPKHILAWDMVMKESGKSFTDEMYASLNGLTSEGFATQLIECYGAMFSSVEEMVERKNQYYLALIPQVPFHEKTVHTLRLYHGRIPIALGTNERKLVTHATLELKGLKPLFSTIVTSEDVERSKPHPDIFLVCADNMHVDPERCHVFEDSRVGMQAAISAGMSVTDVSNNN